MFIFYIKYIIYICEKQLLYPLLEKTVSLRFARIAYIVFRISFRLEQKPGSFRLYKVAGTEHSGKLCLLAIRYALYDIRIKSCSHTTSAWDRRIQCLFLWGSFL